MRKIISVILCLLIVAGLSACGDTASTEKANKKNRTTVTTYKITDKNKGKFRVGFARQSILPENFFVPLGGYGNTYRRLSTGYNTDIVVDCIVVSDADNNTVLLISCDNIGISKTVLDPIVKRVSTAVGVAVDKIMVNTSHSHSTPDLRSTDIGNIEEYRTLFTNQMAKAAADALNCRVPAKMYFGNIQTDRMNFIRHYFTINSKTGEKQATGDNHNSSNYSSIINHTTDADRTLNVLKFEREDEKDVYLTNFRAHPTLTGGGTKTVMSADWVGAMREKAEELIGDCYVTYYQGGAGNINPTSRIDGETYSNDFREHGGKMGEYIAEATKNMTEVKTGKVTAKTQTFTAKTNHRDDTLVPYATIVDKIWKETSDTTACTEAGEQYGIYSAYHASSIIAHAKLGQTMDIDISVVTIGNDCAISFVPFEQFDTNSRYIVENSGYKYTIANGYTNGQYGYIPSAFGYEYGGYESDTTAFAPGSGEEIADTVIEMFKAIKLANK